MQTQNLRRSTHTESLSPLKPGEDQPIKSGNIDPKNRQPKPPHDTPEPKSKQPKQESENQPIKSGNIDPKNKQPNPPRDTPKPKEQQTGNNE
jgi:hypothetical protein